MSFFSTKIIALVLLVAASLNAFSADQAKPKRLAIGELKWAVPLSEGQLVTPEFSSQATLALRTMLNTKLQQTRKFEVLERESLEQIVQELSFMHDSGMVDEKKAVEWGKQAGVDHFILGTITQFTQVKKGGLFSGKIDLLLVVDLRLIDTETGATKAAESIETRINVGKAFDLGKATKLLKRQGGDVGRIAGDLNASGLDKHGENSGLGEQVNTLLRSSAEQIIIEIVAAVAPIQVLGVRGDEIYLNYGKGLLEKGQELDVFREHGEPLILEGKNYGRPQTKVGQIKIIQTHDDMSTAVPSDGLPGATFAKNDECILIHFDPEEQNQKKKKKKKGWFSR